MSQPSSGPSAMVVMIVLLVLFILGFGFISWQRNNAMRLALMQRNMVEAEKAAAQRAVALMQSKSTSTVQPIVPAKSAPDSSAIEAIIRNKLDQQQTAWNAGDIDQFMEVYWKSDQLTFASGGKVTRGWQATLDGYKNRYPDTVTMGSLTFDQLEFKPVGSEVMLVIGNWHLDRESAIGGKFSLLWQEIDQQWVIVHDHTSLADPK